MGKGRSYSRMLGFAGPDQMTVATHTSWSERMGNSCCGSVFGLGLLAAGLALIGWNEYRTVETMQIIEAGEKAVREVSCANGTQVCSRSLSRALSPSLVRSLGALFHARTHARTHAHTHTHAALCRMEARMAS